MSAHRPPTSRHRGLAPAARVLRGATVLLLGTLALGGCGLRLETPPPVEPSPDAVEQVRGRTVADALTLVDAASATAAQGVEEPVRAVLDDVTAFSTRHVEELGGVYDSGLPDPSPSASPAASEAPAADAAGLLALLVDGADRAVIDADEVPDPQLARLVASVAVARDGLADRLAAAAGVPRPEPAPPAATDDGSAPQDTGAVDDGATDAAAPDPAGPAALALAHDEAAWTFTVLAARGADDVRAAMLAAAARHRAASDTWARTAGVVGRPSDPRRAAYALPAGLDDPAVVQGLPRSLEQAVADASATAVAGADAGGRREAVESLRTATSAAAAWGAAPVPFPGMPELATVPVG
ncbi:DUF4439 domain-containing protein [Cellulomonas phragmiteti]|uniref:DUF4439 domain-containing protein n=1 Tax=Cellulomonas phragmiteti TaxID=478780 RepID=A0ABQ4DHS4_9CELL|nr:DUF4439 domain-containing protein [Cellulomonas phragmiteti]GIG38466.1 hypothetical protein Cph01nite_02280 [Cellulomonas phragmiteti]